MDEVRGVVRAEAGTRFDLTRCDVGPALAPFVEYCWIVSWDLRGEDPVEQQVVTHPVVHLVVEDGRADVTGVVRGRFTRRLEGAGRALGVRFRPGRFRPFLDEPVSSITDRVVPADVLLGIDGPRLVADVVAAPDPDAMVAAVETILRPRLPDPDPMADTVGDMVDLIVTTPEIVRVDQLAERVDVGVRQLQRLFNEYVGVGPKFVIQRNRLHEAAARAADGSDVDWAGLAAELGYSDQAHLTRDFTAAVGVPPTTYSRRFVE